MTLELYRKVNKVGFEVLASDPVTNLFEGRYYYNSVNDILRVYEASVWKDVGSGGSGSGSGEKNYITNSSAFVNITGWVSSGAGLTVTRTTTASDLPREFTTGTGIKIVAPVGNPTGVHGYFDFTLDDIDLNKKLKIKWDQKQFGAYVASDFEVYIAAQSARGTILHTPDVTLVPAVDGTFAISFDTASTTTLSLVIRATTDMATDAGLVISDVVVGPGTIIAAAPIGTTKSYTPTISGFGTATSVSFEYAQTSDRISLKGVFTTGTPTAVTANITLPNSYTSTRLRIVGRWYRDVTGGATRKAGTIFTAAGSNVLRFANDDYTASPTPFDSGLLGSDVAGASNRLVIDCNDLVIDQLAGAPNYAGQNDVEYAYNTAGTTAAGSIGAVGSTAYGPAGVAIGNIDSTSASNDTSFYVRFQTAIQATDEIEAEINNPATSQWVSSSLYFARIEQSTSRYGIRLDPSTVAATDVLIRFGNKGAYSNNATYAGNGETWTSTSTFKWRVRKSRSGAAVGFGIAREGQSGLISFYKEQDLDISNLGSFNISQPVLRIVRSGKIVTLTWPLLAHTSISNAVSSATFIPADYRPAHEACSTYRASSSLVRMSTISTGGQMNFEYFNWAGTPTADTSTGFGSMSWVVD